MLLTLLSSGLKEPLFFWQTTGLPWRAAAAASQEKQQKPTIYFKVSPVCRPAYKFPLLVDTGFELGLMRKGVAKKLVCICFWLL